MAKLKLRYDSQDEIPEEFQSLYTEQDGAWVLSGVEGIKTGDDVSRLQRALEKERNDHKETKEKLRKWGELDPDEVHEKLDRLPELEAAADGKLDDEKIEKIVESRVRAKLGPVERENQRLKAERDEALAENNDLKEGNKRRTVADKVREAAAKAKLVPTAIDDALAQAERVFEIDEQGNIVAKDGVGVTPGVAPDVWLTEMQEKRPHWWPASQGGGAGGGAGGGGFGQNPWSKDHWNLTRQGQIHKENPAKAEQMAKAAGTKVAGGTRPT